MSFRHDLVGYGDTGRHRILSTTSHRLHLNLVKVRSVPCIPSWSGTPGWTDGPTLGPSGGGGASRNGYRAFTYDRCGLANRAGRATDTDYDTFRGLVLSSRCGTTSHSIGCRDGGWFRPWDNGGSCATRDIRIAASASRS